MKALQVFPGRSVFELVAGVDLVHAFEGEAPELLVLAAASPTSLPKLMRRAAALPDAAWGKLRAGQGAVVFDAASEGAPAEPGFVEEIHRFLQTMGVAPGRAAYLTQDRGFAGDYAAIRRDQGGEAGLQVIYDDYWIRRLAADFERDGRAVFEARLAGYRARARRRPRRFVSLNLTPRSSKLAFLLNLLRDGLWDQGFVSFGGFERLFAKGATVESLKAGVEHLGFGPAGRDLGPWFEPLARMGEVLLGDGSGSRTSSGVPKLSEDARLPEYDLSWFSVVTETEMRARPSRVTEKPFKPIANFHPFLLLGSPGSLALLRQFGFQTFGEVFDERYDEEPNPGRRFAMVYDQVRALCAAPETELARIGRATEAAVIANAEHLMTRMPLRYRAEVDRRLLDQLGAMIAGG